MPRKLLDNVKASVSLVPAVYSSNQAYGAVTAVDTQGYNDAELLVVAGNLVTVDETYVVEVYECDTSGGTYTATGITVAMTADNTVGVARITDLNVVRKRYLKATLTMTGSNESFPGTAVFLLGEPASGPVNSD
jgi:hypothetical protein